MMPRLFLMLIAALTVATAGVSSAAKPAPALQGYCPVAYVAMSKAVKGNPKIASTHEGRRYVFANAEAKKMFDAAPAKYRVAYDGWCATAVSMGKKVKSDPKLFTVHDGTIYLFSIADARKAFVDMPDDVIAKADAQWSTLAKE
jgi:YHS domain-containing protein